MGTIGFLLSSLSVPIKSKCDNILSDHKGQIIKVRGSMPVNIAVKLLNTHISHQCKPAASGHKVRLSIFQSPIDTAISKWFETIRECFL